jgi:carbon-monoxide dehydrogenase large subunit
MSRQCLELYEVGDAAATEAAFAGAARIVKGRYVISRVHAQFMEPRGALGEYDAAGDSYTLHLDIQYPHRVRDLLASKILKVAPEKIRAVSGDVGGAFGAKGWTSHEHRLVLWLAKKLGRRSSGPASAAKRRWPTSTAAIASAKPSSRSTRMENSSRARAHVEQPRRIRFVDRNLMAMSMNVGSTVGPYTIPQRTFTCSVFSPTPIRPRRTVDRGARKPRT